VFTLPGSKDPQWRPLAGFSPRQLPRETRRWLLDENSLTQRLQIASGGTFRVQRLQQKWQIPLASERRLLELGTRQVALVREVALYCNEAPWVFARSVIPMATLSGRLRHLRHLQNRSLGALIFQNPALQRSPFELCRLPPNASYITPSLRQEQAAWARRSRFVLGGTALLVSEVFLTAFQPWSAQV
jgi:chorismate--pyruvate lyase